MKLVAIDIGKYAGLFNGETAHTEFLGDPPKNFGAPYRHVRFQKFNNFLYGYLLMHAPDVVAYERPFSRGLDATRSGWGYAGIVEAVSTQLGCAVLDPMNGSIRKWATGTAKKSGSKDPMILKAKELTGIEVDEHSADAICMWHYVMETMEVS